jgi:tetratricopeptide (TPR) repeat protein
MDKTKPSASKSSSTEKTSQASASSKHTSVQMVQNDILLIWLDGNIDKKSDDYRNTITEFERVINTVNTFTDGDKCVRFIEGLNNEKVYMVVSGSLGQHIVPRIHDMSQIDLIFVFCGNKNHHEKWAKDWVKIKGVFTEVAPICKALKQIVEQFGQDSVSIEFKKPTSDTSNNSLDPIDSLSFMYTRIMKEIFLTIEFEENDIKYFTDFCREKYADNTRELKNIDMFKREYHNHTPIWWYTYQCFLYAMVNRALKIMDVNIIIRVAFFICDIHRQIEQLYLEQFNKHNSGKIFTVYRGQRVSTADFEKMKNSKGGLLSFNHFLSTSIDRQVSLNFARHGANKSDWIGILFVMDINSSQSTIPFASISSDGSDSEDDEVLFSMHSVFHIRDIKSIDENHRLFQVHLTLTNDTDKNVEALTDNLRAEIRQHSRGWCQLGYLMTKLGDFNKAEEVYEIILNRIPDEREKGNIYHQLGLTKANKDEYTEAVAFYREAIQMCEKTLLSNHPRLASLNSDIGLALEKLGEYSKALESYDKALQIYQKIRPPNHPDLVLTYNNMGLIYNDLGDHAKALAYYEKALEIRQKTLPLNHPDLASSYNNIGLVYGDMSEFSKALTFHERAVSIAQNALSPNDPTLQMYKKNFDAAKKKL